MKRGLVVSAAIVAMVIGGVRALAGTGTYDGAYQGMLSYTANVPDSGTVTGSAPITITVASSGISGSFGPVPQYGTISFSGSVSASGAGSASASFGCALSMQFTVSGSSASVTGAVSGCTDQGGTAGGTLAVSRISAAPPAPAPPPPPPTSPAPSPPAAAPSVIDASVSKIVAPYGGGYYAYWMNGRNWGTPQLVSFVKTLGKEWTADHGGVQIGIGDMSLKGGGAIKKATGELAHAEHQHGLEVDIRPVAKDGARTECSWTQACYDRALTMALAKTIVGTPLPTGYRLLVLFNDPFIDKIPGVCPSGGHDNHLHVRLVPPGHHSTCLGD